jgi:hypothetical protein
MQTYAQRTIQARIRDASGYLATTTATLGTTNQYEPYYLESQYNIGREETTTELLGKRAADNTGLFRMEEVSNRTRGAQGFQSSDYDTALGLINGI